MKKLSVVALTAPLLALALLGAGCGNKSATPPAPKPAAPSAQAPSAAAPAAPTAVTPESNLCRHPYFPLKNGYEIAYRVDAAGRSFDYVMKQSDVTDASAKLSFAFTYPKSFTATQNIICDKGNIRTDGYLDLGGAMTGTVKTETKNVVGDMMPKSLAVGSEWTTTYETVMDYSGMNVPGLKGQVAGKVTAKNKVTAEEDVEVPAGKFRALKVESETTSTATVPGMPTPPQPSKSVTYQWWVAGIGLVKTTDAAGTMNTVATRISGN
ncbi:MAG: hypothetical protein PHT12_01650 [Patescibacteria group bacterium]|nr:hypothetical protein [Patescibacteria group bacterium]